jgi:general secretion pathway protein H
MRRVDRATTSATGISIAESRARGGGAGFTLIELLVVIVIIGMIAAGAILSFGALGKDHELDRESDRLLALMRYAREQAELQTREFGLLLAPGAYTFVTYDARQATWRPVDEDDALRRRALPDGIGVLLTIEGREVVVQPPTDASNLTPQIMIFSNGDLTSFELKLAREGGGTSSRIRIDDEGRIASDAELDREKSEAAQSPANAAVSSSGGGTRG